MAVEYMKIYNSFIIGYSDKYPDEPTTIIRFSGNDRDTHCVANALRKFINNKKERGKEIWDVNVR